MANVGRGRLDPSIQSFFNISGLLWVPCSSYPRALSVVRLLLLGVKPRLEDHNDPCLHLGRRPTIVIWRNFHRRFRPGFPLQGLPGATVPQPFANPALSSSSSSTSLSEAAKTPPPDSPSSPSSAEVRYHLGWVLFETPRKTREN